MYNLNDDCLLLIFNHFNIYELLQLEQVNKQFKRCAEQKYRTYRHFSIQLRTTQINKMNMIFKRIGQYLLSFEYSGGHLSEICNSKVLTPMTEYCVTLETLKLSYIRCSPYFDDGFRKIAANIVTLTLNGCSCSTEFEEILLNYAINLRNIYVSGSCGISIENLSKLRNIERIQTLCGTITDCNYFKIFLENNNLIYFKLILAKGITNEEEEKLRKLINDIHPNLNYVITKALHQIYS